MKTKADECMYCKKNNALTELMMEVAQLRVSTVYLFKEQSYWGRCVIAYNGHVDDICELSDSERNTFMADVVKLGRTLKKVLNPDKINYGAFSDKLPHLHLHMVPKYVNGPDYGNVFAINPRKTYATPAGYEKLIGQLRAELVKD